MLKFLQERVNQATKDHDGLDEPKKQAAGAEATDLLAERQGRVRDLTRKLATKLDKDDQTEGGR